MSSTIGLHQSTAGAQDSSVSGLLVALQALVEAPEWERPWLEEQLVRMVQRYGTPLVHGQEITFVYQNEHCQEVDVLGGINLRLEQIPGTALFRGTLSVPDLDQAAISYTLLVDGSVQRDPWTHCNPVAEGSPVVVLYGDHTRVPEEAYVHSGVPSGTVQAHEITSESLHARRRVWTYVPARCEAYSSYPLLVVADADIYLDGTIKLPIILDNMIEAGKIPPVIAVGLAADPSRRSSEYIYRADQFMDHQAFLVNEVLPWVGTRYPVDTSLGSAVALGMSNGGAWALYTALLHPDIFRGAILQSAVTTEATLPPMSSGKYYYLTAGSLDPAAVHLSTQLDRLLRQGYNHVKFANGVGGHDTALMEAQLAPGLEWVWQNYNRRP